MISAKKKNNRRFSLKAELLFSSATLFFLFVISLISIMVFYYNKNIETNFETQIVSTSEQALNNYINYTSQVVDASDNIQKRLDGASETTSKEKVSLLFDDIMAFNSDIESIAVYDLFGKNIYKNTAYDVTGTVLREDWFVRAIKEPLVNIFSPVYEGNYFILSKYMNIQDEQALILRIEYKFTAISNLIDETHLGSDGHVLIYDKDYSIVYSSKENIPDEEVQKLKTLVLGQETMRIANKSFFAYVSTISNTGWRVAILSNMDPLLQATKQMILFALLFGTLFLCLFILIMYLISTQISTPLVRLQKEMADFEDFSYNSKLQSEIKGTKEVESLNASFILMMNRIHDLALKVVNEEKEQNKAELKALQNQINPHFLYNTLDSVIYMIESGQYEIAENMILSLSKFFRISISKGKNIIPVKSELDHVGYYLRIQKMRFGKNFRYTITHDEEILNYYVIKLILQPIVENALIHGISETEENGAITIDARVKEADLVFTISDNGYGILPEQIAAIKASFADKDIHTGVGLTNVYRRIRLYYGEKADLSIQSVPDEGTTIQIRIPKEGALSDKEK